MDWCPEAWRDGEVQRSESELAVVCWLKGVLLQDWGFLPSCRSAVLPAPGHQCPPGHKPREQRNVALGLQ